MPTKTSKSAMSSASEASSPKDRSKILRGCLANQDMQSLECLALEPPLRVFNLDHREPGCAMPIAHARVSVNCTEYDNDNDGRNTYIWTRANIIFRLNAQTRSEGRKKRCLEILIPLYENTTQDFPSDGIAEQLADTLTAATTPRPSFKRGQKRVYREFDKEESFEKIEDSYRALEWHLADRGYSKKYWGDSADGERAACKAKVMSWLESVVEPSACIAF